jgi:hypothetical protein
MRSHQWTKNFIVVILLSSCLNSLQVLAQQSTSNLYSQTSEMADAMIQYDADKASILRFYSTSFTRRFSFQDNKGPGYNTPERRKRLLELIDEYLEILKKSPFEKWNINGKWIMFFLKEILKATNTNYWKNKRHTIK